MSTFPSDSRIHYVITHGGDAPNIVPEFAEVYYYVRHPQAARVEQLFERVVKAAEGAALGTGTSMDFEVMHGNYPVLPNETLGRMMHEKMNQLGGFDYSSQEAEVRRNVARHAYKTQISDWLSTLGSALRNRSHHGIHRCRRH